jgi:hypothetical protein
MGAARLRFDDLSVADVDESVTGPRFGGVSNQLTKQPGAVADSETAGLYLVAVASGVRRELALW